MTLSARLLPFFGAMEALKLPGNPAYGGGLFATPGRGWGVQKVRITADARERCKTLPRKRAEGELRQSLVAARGLAQRRVLRLRVRLVNSYPLLNQAGKVSERAHVCRAQD